MKVLLDMPTPDGDLQILEGEEFGAENVVIALEGAIGGDCECYPYQEAVVNREFLIDVLRGNRLGYSAFAPAPA